MAAGLTLPHSPSAAESTTGSMTAQGQGTTPAPGSDQGGTAGTPVSTELGQLQAVTAGR